MPRLDWICFIVSNAAASMAVPFAKLSSNFCLDADERLERPAVVGGVVRGDLGGAEEAGDLLVPQRLGLAGDQPAARRTATCRPRRPRPSPGTRSEPAAARTRRRGSCGGSWWSLRDSGQERDALRGLADLGLAQRLQLAFAVDTSTSCSVPSPMLLTRHSHRVGRRGSARRSTASTRPSAGRAACPSSRPPHRRRTGPRWPPATILSVTASTPW